MPSFETPQPIAVTVDLVRGDLRVTAADRADTVATVEPTNPSDAADVCRAMCCTVGPVTAVPYHHCSLGDQIRLRARTPALAAWVGGYCSTFSPFRDTGRTE